MSSVSDTISTTPVTRRSYCFDDCSLLAVYRACAVSPPRGASFWWCSLSAFFCGVREIDSGNFVIATIIGSARSVDGALGVWRCIRRIVRAVRCGLNIVSRVAQYAAAVTGLVLI